MKKLIILIMALAMVAAFMPVAQAADSAQLNLSVTFAAPPQPLIIKSDPEGPFHVNLGETLTFDVIAQDLDTAKIDLVATNMPPDASFLITQEQIYSNVGTIKTGEFKWTPKKVLGSEFHATFAATNAEGERVELTATIYLPQPVISIELNESAWKIDGVKLGEKRSNMNELSVPIHMVRNTGNVSVSFDIGYGPFAYGLVHPGREQGLNTFITAVTLISDYNPADRCELIIPPDGSCPLDTINSGAVFPLRLTYGAPTALSENAQGMSATYEIRAYPPQIINGNP